VALFGIDLSKLLQAAVDKLFSLLPKSLQKIVTGVVDSIRHIATIFTRLDSLFDSIKSEILAWRTFREDVKFKSRVISLPKAYEQTKDFIQSLGDTWKAIVDLIRQFKDKLGEDPAAEAESVASDIESGGVEGGAEGLLAKFPKLAKGLEKLAGVVVLVTGALESISSAIDDLQAIVDEVTRIREEIENADSIFLSQKNLRRTVKLADGGSIKIRVGSLHS
jgi:methyl-accepting chemotaxis protein